MDDDLAMLRREFDADEGAFLFMLRIEARWDDAAFSCLVRAMEHYATRHEGRESIELWIARGFWFLESTTASWVGHPDRKPTGREAYYRQGSERLWDLSYWLFFGDRPYEGKGPLPPL